ncbi:GIY-YIG nuclease family protein [Mangrovibacterium diazotrophicum]|uniref:Putative endonuclease n=1 Tax=Mangrovibacterium diazotrophicum TaxID=1261403 RepID=A0A419W747_9BACT|nr:putative endonuclease [Mangrovibacterium diazotrophicum]
MCYCYILYSESLDRYYVGASSDLEGRLTRHNAAHSGFTSKGQPWRIVYFEEYSDKETAFSRERQLKKWKSRKMIERLCSSRLK